VFLELRKQRNNVSGFTLLLWVLKCSLTSLSILCYFILFFKFWKGKRVCKLCEIINPVKGKGKSVNWGFSPQFFLYRRFGELLKNKQYYQFYTKKTQMFPILFYFCQTRTTKKFQKNKITHLDLPSLIIF